MGLISGREAFRKNIKAGVEQFSAIPDIYPDERVRLAQGLGFSE